MNYASLYNLSIVDGSGIRTSLYVSGCRRHCKGCHNSKTWNFLYGKEYTEETEKQILEALDHDYVKGFTLCGGEPMEEENQRVIVTLLRKIKEQYPQKDIWLWTGYEFEDLLKGGRKYCEVTEEILSYVDVAVVGPFVFEERDISDNNRWRGSRNQRVIDVQESLKKGEKIFIKNIPNNN